MGNVTSSCGSRSKELLHTSFDQFEVEKLRKVFNEIKEHNDE